MSELDILWLWIGSVGVAIICTAAITNALDRVVRALQQKEEK